MGADHHGADGSAISMTAGSRIAGYRLAEQIGQGGMAVVFRARDERLGRTVALKLLAPVLAGNPELQQRFISESRVAASIDDPHIVPVFAAGEADGLLFIAMRYVAGGDAHSLLKRSGRLAPDQVAAIISPVASALDAAHRAGLVHRDVKPSNMLTDVLPGRPMHVYLSDFGISKSVAATSGLTAAGSILGTLAYMSPEQVRSRPVDGRSDQYALACSAYELLAGTPPFQRDEAAALMHAHLFEDPDRLTSLRPGLEPVVDEVLARALAKAPGDRYASCGEFADALRGALGMRPYRPGPGTYPPTEAAWPETPVPTAPDFVTDPIQRRRPRRRFAIAACVAVAAGLAAGLLLMVQSPASPIATVPISVRSQFPPDTGDVYVLYNAGKNSIAEVSGAAGKTANGEIAVLYAQSFPYGSEPVKVQALTLHAAGGNATYTFRVHPTLATRYRVELFRSRTATTPIAASAVKVLYVGTTESISTGQPCTGPVCYESVQATFGAPPSALRVEMSKTPEVYFGISRSKNQNVPPPRSMTLGAGDSAASGPEELSRDTFSVTVTFSYATRSEYANSAVGVCDKDTEATDGIGLPGHHGCGDNSIPFPTGYVG